MGKDAAVTRYGLFAFEAKHEPILPRRLFLRRLARNALAALIFIGVSLLGGMAGYHWFEEMSWIDAFANASMILSVTSTCVTFYFWLVKMNRERMGLRLYRMATFKPDRLQCSTVPGTAKAIWYGEILITNPSTMPTAVINCRVQLYWKGEWRDGTLQMEKKDAVPWTVEPLRVLARSFGCCFLVDENTPQDALQGPQRLRFLLETVDGRTSTLEIQSCDAAQAATALRIAA